ncbi:MAG TPA: cysteine synthase family protein [Candidatus Acidoferrum sp.]|nr:cysteine synthase family protein [Candidatus Acidoferrum sp.]
MSALGHSLVEDPLLRTAEQAEAIGTALLDCIGRTPLIRLTHVAPEFSNIEFYAKAEWFNPGGSVKDRAALAMIREGERSGTLRSGKTILDATSGNTGIAYAMIGAAKRYPVTLCLPESASHERKRILRAFGAELLFTPADEGSDGAIRLAQKLYAADPARYFYADQYSNPANWRAHYETTAAEIWEQTRGRITHFCAGLGTTGTFTGITRRLKELNPQIRCTSLQPDSGFHGLEGWKHMASAIVPRIWDPSLADDNLFIRTEDAYRTLKLLARVEGLLVSPSSAGAFAGCLAVAMQIPRGERAVIVTVFPDSADKYLSERFWEDEEESAT